MSQRQLRPITSTNYMKDSTPSAARLQSAVEAIATPKGVQAEVRQSGRYLSVRLSRPGQLALDTEDTTQGWRKALHQAKAALAGSFFAGPTSAPHRPRTDEYLPPLDQSASELLLTASERETCRVFALADWRTEEAGNGEPYWAVCQPCPREQWGSLERGEAIIYTELYTFGSGDDEPGATTLVTHIGRLLVYDKRRGMFYASEWNGGDDCTSELADDNVQEVWRVVRLIPVH
jgi:hypothetical protein